MTQQEREIYGDITMLAEEQVLFLKNRYKMQPADIIELYGGQVVGEVTYDDAVERIATFNFFNATSNGFMAS